MLTSILLALAIQSANIECVTAQRQIEQAAQLDIKLVYSATDPAEVERLRNHISQFENQPVDPFTSVMVFTYGDSAAFDLYQVVLFQGECTESVFKYNKTVIDLFFAK
jgi:hypothetical protein